MTGQGIAILVLAILLILAIGFGGVYAFYSVRTDKVTGKIMLANLDIDLKSGSSDKTDIIISGATNIVPGQKLKNSPLIVTNNSNTSIYLAVVYRVKAKKLDNDLGVDDKFEKPMIDVGYDYINGRDFVTDSTTEFSTKEEDMLNTSFVDYVFVVPEEKDGGYYRCLICLDPVSAASDEEGKMITVIKENSLALHGAGVGGEYMKTEVAFTFQAYAIASESFGSDFGSKSKQERCNTIIGAICENYAWQLLTATTT